MDRLELEDLADRVVDKVQFDGYAVVHDVSNPAFLRKLVRDHARQRSMRIRTGVAQHSSDTVWAIRPERELEFVDPVTDEKLRTVAERMDQMLTDVLKDDRADEE